MNPTNTGSFGAAAGGLSPELQASIQRRGTGQQNPLQQVTNSAPTMDNSAQPTLPLQEGATSQPTQPGASTGGQQLSPKDGEIKMILGALNNRLKHLSNMEKLQVSPTTQF